MAISTLPANGVQHIEIESRNHTQHNARKDRKVQVKLQLRIIAEEP